MARRGRGRRTKEMEVIASERIQHLMMEADKAALQGRLPLADRYVEMARRIGMRYNVRIPSAMKRRYCRRCYGYLLPSATSRTRMKRGRVVTTCLRCGHILRMPLAERIDMEDVRTDGEGAKDEVEG